MKLLMTGASGFIGDALVQQLTILGYELVLVARNLKRLQAKYGPIHEYVQWDCLEGPPPEKAFAGVEGVINLMGEGILNRRWSQKQKQRLYDTRVLGTRHLVVGVRQFAPNLRVFVSSSAIGFYDQSQPLCDTDSKPGSGFLGTLCQDWESALSDLEALSQVRVVRIRTGIVLGDGGVMTLLKWLVLFGLAARIGSGQQWVNWIHIDDITRLFIQSVQDVRYQGVYNGVSPNPLSQYQFMASLAQQLSRPMILALPAVLVRLVLGELSIEVTQGARVSAKRLLGLGFVFRHPHLETALKSALNYQYISHLDREVRCHRHYTFQYLPVPNDTVFSFFSDAENLERITPAFLNFKIASQSTAKIQKDTLFEYHLKIRGLPVKWRSKIADWDPINSFIDTQLKGPYYVWHHYHRFHQYQGGTIIEDEVYFALPRIPIIASLISTWVKRDVASIFDYRKKVIKGFFDG